MLLYKRHGINGGRRKAVDNKAFGELLTDLLKASDSLSHEDLIEELHNVCFMMFH